MFCTICATANSRDARECSACGVALRHPRPLGNNENGGATGRRWLHFVQVFPLLTVPVILIIAADLVWSSRTERASTYAAAIAALADGDLIAARSLFIDLGDYREAEQRLAETTQALIPYEAGYETARVAVTERRFDDAIARLVPIVRDLPSYRAAVSLLEETRNLRRDSLLADAAAAATDGDWLAAERALAAVAADDPTDFSVAAELAGVRRNHAPLVYARAGAIFVVGPDGERERAVTPSMDASWPIWNPARTQIAFIQRHPGGAAFDGTLCVVDLDGSHLRILAERAMPFLWPTWSPDGTKLAFASAEHFDENRGDGRIGLHVVDLTNGVEIDLTGDRLPHAYSPSWSPDGSRIAFVSYRFERRRDGGLRVADGEVYTVDVATLALTDVTRGQIVDEGWVAWSPRGDRILIFTVPGNWTNPQQSQIFLLDATTYELTEIPTHSWEISLPAWSPDGSRFAYVEGDHVVRIWSETGEDWIRVDTALAPFVSWSPDGSALFASANDARAPSYVIPLDDSFGARVPITLAYDASNGNGGPPPWSPRTPPPVTPSTSTRGTALDAR
jgi:Tol biopolymer transport system component